MTLSVLTAVVFSVATTTSISASECFGIDARTTKQRSTLVFEGTIRNAEQLDNGEIGITMDVHRVWKGKVGKQVTVYLPAQSPWGAPHPPPPVTTRFKAGERFIVFTNAAFEGRPQLAQRRTSWIDPCYGLKRPDADVIKQLGRSRKPKDT
jgi:hypothetical protein